MTIPELIEILKAAESGKVIEYKIASKSWEPLQPKALMFRIGRAMSGGPGLFRVKPDPREWWLTIDASGNAFYAWKTFELAQKFTSGKIQPIHVREVLP